MKKFNDNEFDKFFREQFYDLEKEPPISIINRLEKNIASQNTTKNVNKYYWFGGLSLAIVTLVMVLNSFNPPLATNVSTKKLAINNINTIHQNNTNENQLLAQEVKTNNIKNISTVAVPKQTNKPKASNQENTNTVTSNVSNNDNVIPKSTTKITKNQYQTIVKAATCRQANGKATIKCEQNANVQFYWANMNKIGYEFNNLKSGTYIVLAKTENQILDTLYITIPDSGNVFANFKIYDVKIGNEMITFFENQSKIDKKIWKDNKNLSFYWNFGDGTYSNQAEPQHSYQNSGNYEVNLTITSSQGCRDSVTKLYLVTIPQNFAELPNIFSPNNDGINDYFQPTYYDMQSVECSIYSRSGELVYEWKDIDGKWDGKIRNSNQLASPGTYYYILKGITKKGKQVLHKGMVQLVL